MAEQESPERVIENPITGERIVIRTTAADSDGALLAFDLYLPPGGHVPAAHVHPIQEERFTVIDGEWRFRLGRRTIVATVGQTVLVPPGTAHWFGTHGERAGHARVEVRPALRMEELLTTTESLARSAHGRRARLPRVHDLAVMLLDFQRELAVPLVPARLMRWLLWPLAWFARRRRRVMSAPVLEP